MMDARTAIYVVVVVFIAIIGVYAFLFKHVWGHPRNDDIVKKEVCNSEKHRIEDCIEGAMKLAEMQYKVLVKKLDELTVEVRSMNGRK